MGLGQEPEAPEGPGLPGVPGAGPREGDDPRLPGGPEGERPLSDMMGDVWWRQMVRT
jgi:hypothetical protein